MTSVERLNIKFMLTPVNQL